LDKCEQMGTFHECDVFPTGTVTDVMCPLCIIERETDS